MSNQDFATAHQIAQHQPTVIWGFGQEGQACYQYLTKTLNAENIWILTDEYQADLADYPNYIYAEKGLAKLSEGAFKLVIKSPGISLYRDELVQAKQNGSLVSSSTNLWFERYPDAKTIIVTGTKGKSTTASLLGHLMQSLDLDVVVAGNLGLPLIAVTPASDYTILELSSYQLADLNAHTNAFILLNLFQEHVPWHQSAQQYYLDKTRPARNQECDLLICNAESKLTQTYLIEPAKQQNTLLQPVYFNQKEGFYCEQNTLFYGSEKLQFPFNLKGEHNLKNLAACLTLLNEWQLNWRLALEKLAGFDALAHRLEDHEFTNGIIAVNDSISTTPDSTLCALKCYQDKAIYLILGGAEREQDYQMLLAELLHYQIKLLALIGDTGQRIKHWLDSADLPDKPTAEYQYYSGLPQAMSDILSRVQADEVVLLSPAAPSFGEFKNYQHRGECFIELMQKANS